MNTEFEEPPDGGLTSWPAAQQMVSQEAKDALRLAIQESARYPATVRGWETHEVTELETGRTFATQEQADLPHPTRLRVFEIEQRLKSEFLELWRGGQIVALAAELRPGARWYRLQPQLMRSVPWARLAHYATSFWVRSELKLSARGPLYSLLFYTRDQLDDIHSRKAKPRGWKELVRDELARRDNAQELDPEKVQADDGYQAEVIDSIFGLMCTMAARQRRKPPSRSSVATYVKTGEAWASVRTNAAKRSPRLGPKSRR